MDELKQTDLKKPFRSTNNDAAMLRALINEMRGDKPMTAEELAENERIYNAELAKAQSVENIPHAAQVAAAKPVSEPPAPAAPITQCTKIFLTGQPGSGIEALIKPAAEFPQVVNIQNVALKMLKAYCQLRGNPEFRIVADFRQLGDGEFAQSIHNIFFLGMFRQTDPDFGGPSYWARKARMEVADPRAIIVGLRTSAEFTFLKEQGYTHYHAMCSPQTLAARRPKEFVSSGLHSALDADVHKNISMRKDGPRLNVVWTDPNVASPSGRFISEKDFRESVLGVAPSVVGFEGVSQPI